MMMDSPKIITADMIREQVIDFGLEHILDELDIIITKGENIAKNIDFKLLNKDSKNFITFKNNHICNCIVFFITKRNYY